jgi:hypothetical protein
MSPQAAAGSEPAQKGPATKGKMKVPAEKKEEKKEEKEEEEEEAAPVKPRGKPPSLALVLQPGVTLVCFHITPPSMRNRDILA